MSEREKNSLLRCSEQFPRLQSCENILGLENVSVVDLLLKPWQKKSYLNFFFYLINRLKDTKNSDKTFRFLVYK